jgi:maleamate amidohydrolase
VAADRTRHAKPGPPRWWEEPFLDEPGAVYRSLRRRLDTGGRPALLLIDVVTSFVGPRVDTLEEAVAVWPTACGPAALDALPHLAHLLEAARRADVAVVHCRPGAERATHYGDTVKGELGPEWVNGRPGAVDFAPEVAPRDGELIIPKPKASAFFDTGLATVLHRARITSVVVGGGSTSGCVRASAVDAFSHGFSPFVVEDAVFDRSPRSAGASLWDLDCRYADVIRTPDAIDLLLAPPAAQAPA